MCRIKQQVKPNEKTWWSYVTRAENSFLAYWSAESDVLLYETSDQQQRQILKELPNAHSFVAPLVVSLLWKSLKFLFVLFSIYQVVYGTYQNLLYSMHAEGSSSNHFFHYGAVTAYLDFWRQPHLILTIHSVCGTFFLLSCMLQVGIVRFTLFGSKVNRVQFHRKLGLFSIINSLIASSCAIWLSFRALFGTEIVYLLGTATWFYFTAMTIIRALQKQWIAHSRWALALQQIGLMFVTTRIYAPLYLFLGASVDDSYHWGVWSAGVTALFGFCYLERSRQEVIFQLMTRKDRSLPKRDLQYASQYQFFNRAMFWFLFAIIFVGAPLLRYSAILHPWIDVNVWLTIQAGLLLPFYFFLMSQNLTKPNSN
mmetsp:Transcript_11091/g.13727  ORF Transcript_11091/g.13727 Transcript_11091/m.13727 type:complete len:368 (-) Transcript_11091:92-1195(-)